MKRISRIIYTLALLLGSLGAVPAANAALLAFSPNPSPFGGMPTWYQGTDGVAVKPCLEAGCGLASEPLIFNAAAAPVFGANFPTEGFYFLANSDDFTVGNATVFVIMALEFTTVSPAGAVGVSSAIPGAVTAPFQRLRIVIKPPAGGTVAAGTWTLQHPWGTTTFDSTTACRTLAQTCRMTIDIPAPGAVPPNFAGAKGPVIAVPGDPANTLFSIDTFLKSTAAPVGALGDAATSSTVTGGTVRNSVILTSPLGTGTTSSFVITGKIIGMDVQPGNKLDLGATNIVTPAAVARTVTVTNTTLDTLTFPALVAAGADLADFTITSPSATVVPGVGGCSASTVAPGVICSFDIAFRPAAVAKAPRSANILLNPTAGAALPPPPVILNLSGTAQVTVTALGKGHGTITPDTLDVDAGSNVTFTVAPTNLKFKVKDVADGATLLGTTGATATLPNTPPFTLPVGAANHVVTATFMASGDLDANGTLDVADAIKALRIVAGVQIPDTDDPDSTAVKVAPLVGGKPAPVATRVEPNIGDVLVILRRVLNLDTW
jgi:hypothetical protein